jgi:rod shape-determining protein MreD
MLPRGGDTLLLPVNPAFIAMTLLGALGLALVPWGRVPAAPDPMALALTFWCVHQPRRVGVGVCFAFGLLMDVHDGALLGQHALAYTLLGHVAVMMSRRLRWFGSIEQAVQVLPLFAGATAVCLAVGLLAGGMFPGWSLVWSPLLSALLWPAVTWVLLMPQRRPPDPDKHRPL